MPPVAHGAVRVGQVINWLDLIFRVRPANSDRRGDGHWKHESRSDCMSHLSPLTGMEDYILLRMMRVIVCVISLAICAAAADTAPVVPVTGGQIRGSLLEKGGAVFKGIPFAQPPVGPLRWRESLLVKPWTGVRDATAFGPPCAQNANGRMLEASNEDC